MITELKTVSVKLPVEDLRRIPDRNISRYVRQSVHERLAREAKPAWEPKTPAGKRRALLRAAYLKAGGETLDAEGIAAEIRARRGGLA